MVHSTATDLLLLNFGNLEFYPIFPYAFVQVSEIAGRYGLSVRREDLTFLDTAHRAAKIERLIREVTPRMIGITIRQSDTLVARDYLGQMVDEARFKTYFPVLNAKRGIEFIRKVTDVPIVLGGIGFTTHSRQLLEFLRPDFGVRGSPDDFFARFEDVLASRALETVSNLSFPVGNTWSEAPRVFHAPAQNAEYDDVLVSQALGFYGSHRDPSSYTLPIEVMRGCPFHCYFCSEPNAKGPQFNRRPIGAILEDVDRLARAGAQQFWFICSELNLGGTGFAVEIADALIKYREAHGTPQLNWRAYHLPTMPLDVMRHLRTSGFRGGWNDVPSLDDENLRKTRVPYRSAQVVSNIRNYLALDQEEDDKLEREGKPVEERIRTTSLFLGNAYATAGSIAKTAEIYHRERLKQHFDKSEINPASRVFDYGNKRDFDQTNVFSVGPNGIQPDVNVIWPTYQYPADLIERLGSVEAVDDFLEYVGSTLLSQQHLYQKDWNQFLREAMPIDEFYQLASTTPFDESLEMGNLEGDEDVEALVKQFIRPVTREGVRRLYAGSAVKSRFHSQAAEVIIHNLLSFYRERNDRVLDFLGIPYDADGVIVWDEYELTRALGAKFQELSSMIEHVRRGLSVPETSVEILKVKHIMYDANVKLRPEYHAILFPNQSKASP